MHREKGGGVMVMVGDLGLCVGSRGNACALALRNRLGCLRQTLKVKLVGVAFSVHLVHDIFVIVIAQRAAQFVVVHVWF